MLVCTYHTQLVPLKEITDNGINWLMGSDSSRMTSSNYFFIPNKGSSTFAYYDELVIRTIFTLYLKVTPLSGFHRNSIPINNQITVRVKIIHSKMIVVLLPLAKDFT
jgi:hypothetical protein